MNKLDQMVKSYGFELTNPSTLLEHSPGWRSLLDSFLVRAKFGGYKLKLTEVQETNGRMSIRYSVQDQHLPTTVQINRLVQETEDASLRVCQLCGRAATRSARYWYKTLCLRHQK